MIRTFSFPFLLCFLQLVLCVFVEFLYLLAFSYVVMRLTSPAHRILVIYVLCRVFSYLLPSSKFGTMEQHRGEVPLLCLT